MKKIIFLFLFVCSGANSAQLVGSEILLCDNGYSADNSTCTTYEVGDCSADYYDVKAGATTFVSSVNDTCSVAGYKSRTLPDTTIELIYYGMVVGSEILLCDNGYSPDNSTCTEYVGTADCPTDYYGVNVETATFAKREGTCSSGYKQYEAEDSCGFEPASTCISYCENGDMTTGAGGCSALCSSGATTLRTSTGLKYPLWATKQTTPSINIGFPSGERCYVNLTEEATDSQAIWIRLNGTKMHAMK